MLKELKKKDFWVISALILFTVINAFWLIPSYVAAEGTSSSYPHLLNIIFGIFSIGYLIDYGITRSRAVKNFFTAVSTAGSPSGSEGKESSMSASHLLKVVLILVSVFIWVFLLEKIGFLLATFLFLTVTSFIYGERSSKKIFIFSIFFPLLIVIIFILLNAGLPSGIIEETLHSLIK